MSTRIQRNYGKHSLQSDESRQNCSSGWLTLHAKYDDDDGDSDDDGQEQSTRLSSERLGKHNRKLPTNKKKTHHGRRLNCSSG